MDLIQALPPKPKLTKSLDKMTKEEAMKLVRDIDAYQAAAAETIRQLQEADPFWFYEPSTGDVPKENYEFLLKHLKPEDVPPRLTGQLDAHLSRAPVRGISGGNQGGKTLAGCIEAFIAATGAVPKSLEGKFPKERIPTKFPQHIRVVGKDWTNGILLNVIPTYQRWVPREFLKGGRWDKSYNSERATLYLEKAGKLYGTIEFMSNAQDVTSFQGPPRDMMIYDEEPRKDIYKENLLRFTTRDRLNILFCMTPTEGLTWIHDDLVSKEKDEAGNRVEWFQIPSVCNKKANLRVLEEIVQDLTYDEKKMRLLGEFISLSGLVYGRAFSNKLHVIEPFDVSCQCGTQGVEHPDWCPWSKYLVIRGIDPHLVTPAAVVWVAVDRFENAYVVKSMFEETDIESLKRRIAGESAGMRLGWSVVDSAADSNIEAFGGLNIFKKLTTGENRIRALRLAVKGQGSIKTGVDEIKQALAVNPNTQRPRLFVFNTPQNKLLINAFNTMERDRGHNEDKKGARDKILESKHHLHAALRYVFMQRLRWREPVVGAVPDVAQFEREEVFA
jgi:phage terminase large subunit-like protein